MHNFQTPTDLLGQNAEWAKQITVSTMRENHRRYAEAQDISGSSHALVYGASWRDLADGMAQAFKDEGFRLHKSAPAGYEVPIVNECLIYAWRRPEATPSSAFASSKTKQGLFTVPMGQQALFEPRTTSATTEQEYAKELCLKDLVTSAHPKRPVIVAIRESNSQTIQSISWAIAEYDAEDERVFYRGHETLWAPSWVQETVNLDKESFDSGQPSGPQVEPRDEKGINRNE